MAAQQVAGQFCEAAVARTFADAFNEIAPLRWRRGTLAAVGRRDLGQQPNRRVRDRAGTVDGPRVSAAAGMDRWRRNNETAGAANIDASGDFAGVARRCAT